ncbi:MAG TPA: hypothetical protein VMS08_01110 [Candidatus Saccharimonadia bacterium]|nr:hypothetical protein [Candidatus Saccharimonadia bacterium]
MEDVGIIIMFGRVFVSLPTRTGQHLESVLVRAVGRLHAVGGLGSPEPDPKGSGE